MEQPSPSILVIDPDAASRNYLSAMLTKSGYTVLVASSGREGLISAWRDLPQAIILDPVITDMQPLDIVTRLRADRRTAKVPLVVLTSHEDQQECSALLSAGCNECLVKSSQALTKLIELLPRLFSMGFTPKKMGVLIAFLSAKGGSADKVKGLELGADDFIVKPFGVKEVVARIRAVTRRCLAARTQAQGRGAAWTPSFKLGDLAVYPAELRARRVALQALLIKIRTALLIEEK
jgi:DNA-binding response OmpR family regulator